MEENLDEKVVFDERVVGLARLAAMLVSSGATIFGASVDAGAVYVFFGCLLTIGAIVCGWWFNNNMTLKAVISQLGLNAMKAEGER